MSKDQEQAAKEYISRIKADFLRKIEGLVPLTPITQSQVYELQQQLLERFQEVVNSNPLPKGDVLFKSDMKKDIYELVNVLEESIRFSITPDKEGDDPRESTYHWRILLWTGEESCAHTHPASGNLKEKELACVAIVSSPGAIDVRYDLDGAASGKVKSVTLLPSEYLGVVDLHSEDLSKKLAHKFVPENASLEGIKVISKEDRTIREVKTITMNFYKEAGVSKAADGAKVHDQNEEFTRRGITIARRISDWIGVGKVPLKLVPDSEKGTFKTEFNIHDKLRKVSDYKTRDDYFTANPNEDIQKKTITTEELRESSAILQARIAKLLSRAGHRLDEASAVAQRNRSVEI